MDLSWQYLLPDYNGTKQGGKTEFVILENWCKVSQRSLCVTRVIDDNIIEKQPTK